MLNLLSLLFVTAVALPEGGTPVFSASPLATMQEVERNPYGSLSRITADNETTRRLGVTEILRCEVTAQPQNPRGFRFQFRVDREIKKDEVLLLRFYARTIDAKTEAGNGIVQPFFEKASPPVARLLERRVEFSRDWKGYTLPFRAADSYPANECVIGINLGYQQQTVEIAEFMLYSYGTDFDIRTIPDTLPKYSGQELDAHWRLEAEKRIEQIRKGDLQIRLVDANGRSIADADVEIRMKRHAFGWGSAVTAPRILQQDADGERYRDIIETYFNRVVFENDMKWPQWINERNRASTLQAVQWLRDRNIDIRGHCLLWASWRWSPRHLRELEHEPEKLRAAIMEHIQDTASTLHGSLIDWDVLNEPYDNNDIIKILGNEEMIKWFQAARAADPDATLYLNDYGILSAEGRDIRKQNFFVDTIRFLLDNDAPIGGIGFQGHFGTHATPPDRMLAILDRFGQFGLPISITEHDIDSDDEQFQADFTRDFLTAMFSHPSVEAVLTWGFWERAHWRPRAAYYRADWSLRPAGQVWLDLVTKQWWSNFDEKTDTNGEVAVRGFLGDYEITIRKDGRSKTVNTTIPRDGKQLAITWE